VKISSQKIKIIMKTHPNDMIHKDFSGDRSNQNSSEDYNLQETINDLEMLYIRDDDEIMTNDFVMYNTDDQDYDE
jgi:hypothetical protein